MALGGDEHVVGLEIAMDDADRVRGRERREHFARDLDEATERQRSRTQRVGERTALDELHDDVRPPVGQHRHVDHVDDALVANEVDRARFGEEPLEQLRVARALLREDLDRDPRADHRLHREVHAAHPALAEQARESVATDLGPDQRIVGLHHRHDSASLHPPHAHKCEHGVLRLGDGSSPPSRVILPAIGDYDDIETDVSREPVLISVDGFVTIDSGGCSTTHADGGALLVLLVGIRRRVIVNDSPAG